MAMLSPKENSGIQPALLLSIVLASLFTLCFILFVIEQLGIDPAIGSWIMLFFICGLYLVNGAIGTTMSARTWFTNHQLMIPVYNGMAVTAALMSTAIIGGVVGQFYSEGLAAFFPVMGCLVALFIAGVAIVPYYKNSGAYTPAEFIGARYDSRMLRLVLIVTTLIVSGTLLLAQAVALGVIGAIGFGISPQTTLVFCGGVILIMLVLGGLKSLGITRAGMFLMMICGLFVPLIWLSQTTSAIPIPQLSVGESAMQPILKLETELANQGLYDMVKQMSVHLDPSALLSLDNWLLFVAIACGTAGFPHILHMFTGEKGTFSAKQTAAYSLVYTAIFVSILPVIAMFLRWEVLGSIASVPLKSLPGEIPWAFAEHALPINEFISICNKPITTLDDLIAACGGDPDKLFRPQDLQVSPMVLVLLGPEIAGLSSIFSALLAGALLASVLSTLDGLLFSISASLSHDLYYKVLRPRASASTRLFWARVVLIALVGGLGWLAFQNLPYDHGERLELIKDLVILSFSYSLSVFFPLLILTIWWKRLSIWGALAGALCGLLVTSTHVFYLEFGNDLLWRSGDEISRYVFSSPSTAVLFETGFSGCLANIIACILVSLVLPARQEAIERLERLRAPNIEPMLQNDLA